MQIRQTWQSPLAAGSRRGYCSGVLQQAPPSCHAPQVSHVHLLGHVWGGEVNDDALPCKAARRPGGDAVAQHAARGRGQGGRSWQGQARDGEPRRRCRRAAWCGRAGRAVGEVQGWRIAQAGRMGGHEAKRPCTMRLAAGSG